MAYTVKELSELAGVSVRTLQWYDKVGLLKPAYYGANGYRYYEEEQLLQLQQVLFFRELGFKLSDIKKVMLGSDFDKMRALSTHKRLLKNRLDKTKQLIQTVEKTLSRLRGKIKMEDKELYAGFDEGKQAEYEQYLVDRYGDMAKDRIEESKQNVANWSEKDWLKVKEDGVAICHDAVDCLENNLDEESDEMQCVVQRHCRWIEQFYSVNKEVYLGLADLYCSHEGFRQYYQNYHPKLPEYFAEAMRVFAQKHL